MILGCLFQYRNETTLGLTRRTLEGLVAWRPLFNNRGQGHLYSEDSLSVRCGKLSCLALLSLLAALISSPVLLHSVWSGEQEHINVGFESFSFSPNKSLPSPSCTPREFKWHRPSSIILFPPNLVAIFVLMRSPLYLTQYTEYTYSTYCVLGITPSALHIFTHIIFTTNL